MPFSLESPEIKLICSSNCIIADNYNLQKLSFQVADNEKTYLEEFFVRFIAFRMIEFMF